MTAIQNVQWTVYQRKIAKIRDVLYNKINLHYHVLILLKKIECFYANF